MEKHFTDEQLDSMELTFRTMRAPELLRGVKELRQEEKPIYYQDLRELVDFTDQGRGDYLAQCLEQARTYALNPCNPYVSQTRAKRIEQKLGVWPNKRAQRAYLLQKMGECRRSRMFNHTSDLRSNLAYISEIPKTPALP